MTMKDITRKMTRAELALLTPEQKYERDRAKNRIAVSKYQSNPINKAKQRAYDKAYYAKPEVRAKAKVRHASTTTHYVVYKHTSPEGSVYIGEGANLRATDFHNREEKWKDAFNKETVKVEILHKFDTKKEAQIKEAELINKIGIENLINTIAPKAA